MSRRELIFIDASTSKFWNIELSGNSHTVQFGKIGTNGQSKTKEFDSDELAKKDFDKLVNAKLKKGYVDHQAEESDASDGQIPFTAFASIKKHDDIYENVKRFCGWPVADYDQKKGPAKDGKTVYRFRSDWEEETLIPNLTHFLESGQASEAKGLVIGNWSGEDSDGTPDDAIKLICDNKDSLQGLTAIYIGDIVMEENEMSWIQQTDLSPILECLPNLQVFRSRGAEGLSFSSLNHSNLRALAIESGGLGADVVRSVCSSNLPNLEYLELWLGTEDYGGSSSVEDLQPILQGDLFPKLKYLGLRNCDYTDNIAAVIVNSPVVKKIQTLDLSFGVLSDEGAASLKKLPTDGNLKDVNLHHNFLSKDSIKDLNKLDLRIDTSKSQESEDADDWRFVAVGE